MVKILLEHGADVNKVAADGTSILKQAVDRGSLGLVKLLLQHGADVNHVDYRSGETVLHSAAIAQSIDLLSVLLESASVPIKVVLPDKHGRTALAAAWSSSGRGAMGVASMLL